MTVDRELELGQGPELGPAVRFADVEGLRVAYRSEGTGGPALLLLHGFSASQDSWLAVTAALADERRVITFDRPGFGLTRLPDHADDRRTLLSPAGEVKVVLGLLDQLGIEHAVLIGHSMGGAIAAEVALDASPRVVGLVLEDAAIGPAFGPRPLARRVAGNRVATSLGPKVMSLTAPRAFRFFLPLIYEDPSRVPPEIRAAYRRMVRRRDWSTGLWEMATFFEDSDLDERIDRLRVPTLVITGDRDRVVSPEVAYGLARRIEGSHLVVIPRCGHAPHEEHPRDFVAAVRPFLDSALSAVPGRADRASR